MPSSSSYKLAATIFSSTLAVLTPMPGHPAQPGGGARGLSESYVASTSFDMGENAPKGKLLVCAELKNIGSLSETIFVLVEMSDSKQVLMVEAPVKKLKNGAMTFPFNDGSGGVGQGTFKKNGARADLSLKLLSRDADGDPNIGRNYGDFTLLKGECTSH